MVTGIRLFSSLRLYTNKLRTSANLNPLSQSNKVTLRPTFPLTKSNKVLNKTQQVTSSEMLKTWLNCERYVNGINPRPNNPLATYSEMNQKYRPDSPDATFDVPLYGLPRGRCKVYTASNCDPAILKKYTQNSTVFFAVHPQISTDMGIESIREINEFGHKEQSVSPTASSRTVFANDSTTPAHCIKLHFPLQITRSVRHLEKRKIAHSIQLSTDLAKSRLFVRNPGFAYFPESFGAIFGEKESSWGFLVREMSARPFIPQNRQILPLFALYSPNKMNPQAVPILTGLIELSKMDPTEFVLSKILFPLLKCWADVFLETGILLEAHGQNTCLELDETGLPTRMVFRDFDTHVSADIRQKQGMSLDNLNPYEVFSNKDTAAAPQGSTISVLFDQAMRVPFDRIAQFMEKHYGVAPGTLQKACRKYLKDVFPEGDLFFPKGGKVYNYDRGPLTVGAKAVLVETGEPPVWR